MIDEEELKRRSDRVARAREAYKAQSAQRSNGNCPEERAQIERDWRSCVTELNDAEKALYELTGPPKPNPY